MNDLLLPLRFNLCEIRSFWRCLHSRWPTAEEAVRIKEERYDAGASIQVQIIVKGIP